MNTLTAIGLSAGIGIVFLLVIAGYLAGHEACKLADPANRSEEGEE